MTSLYCARGQAENLIKLHKTQLASDRTSCRSPLANQVRLVLHTAAYWLMLTVRDAIPKPQPLARAEFATLRLRLLKIAARVTETAAGCASPSPPPVPTPSSSAACRQLSPPDPEPWGVRPLQPAPSLQRASQVPAHAAQKHASTPRVTTSPATHTIALMNKSG